MLHESRNTENTVLPKSSGGWERALAVSAEDASAILEHTSYELRDEIDLNGFRNVLDFVTMRSLGAMRVRLNSEEFLELRTAFDTYAKVSIACSDKQDSPPPFPNEWLVSTKAWIECMDNRFSHPKVGSPVTPFVEAFYPWVLAAFPLCFNRAPKPSENGPTNRFVLSLAEVSIRKLDALQEDAKKAKADPLSKLEIARVRGHWPKKINANQVRSALRRAMGLEKGFEERRYVLEKYTRELEIIFLPGVQNGPM